MRRAASRAAWTAGKSKAIKTAMMAMTTSSSMSVNPRAPLERCVCLIEIPQKRSEQENGIDYYNVELHCFRRHSVYSMEPSSSPYGPVRHARSELMKTKLACGKPGAEGSWSQDP